MARNEVEQWFVARGVPHFIDGYEAARDIFTRSIPTLVGAYLLVGLNALDIYRWSLGRNLLVAVGIVALVVVTWAVANRLRRRPTFERPREVGNAELAVFIVGPALPSLVFGQQWGDALQTALEAAGLLLVIYVGTSYAVIPLTRWAVRHLVRQLRTLIGLVVRALPLLLLIVTFTFLGAEVWEMAAALPLVVFPVVLALFALTGSGLLLSGQIGQVSGFGSWDDVRRLVTDTPAVSVALPVTGVPPLADLSRRERLNLALIVLFTQGVQIAVVAVTTGVFLTVLGFLILGEATIVNWTQQDQARVLLSLDAGPRDLVLTAELLRVSTFLAIVTGFYFAVYLATDAAYRQSFSDDMHAELEQALAVRAAYRQLLEGA
jgi:hypothetical protein